MIRFWRRKRHEAAPWSLGGEVCRALKRLGFVFVRQTGSHSHYTKGSLHPCVPMHRTLKPKTLQPILKQANISAEDLLDNL